MPDTLPVVCGRCYGIHTIGLIPYQREIGGSISRNSLDTGVAEHPHSGSDRYSVAKPYEQPLPTGRKNYTKTAPMQFEEFADCLAWWPKRVETERAWKVSAKELIEAGCNLDRKNPNAKPDAEHLPPEQLVDGILTKEAKIG